MSTFTAGVQYGDWSGTVAADNTDHGSGKRIEDFVKKEDDEFLLAAQLYVGEPHDKSLAEPYIHAYLLKGVEKYEEAEAKLEELKADGEPIPVREVTMSTTRIRLCQPFLSCGVERGPRGECCQ
jgi:hypothetical protein